MMLSAASESGAHALRVGASVLAPAGADLTPAERRQRASLELLRLAAIEEGLLAAEDPTPEDGVLSEEAAEAIDAWVARQTDNALAMVEAERQRRQRRQLPFPIQPPTESPA